MLARFAIIKGKENTLLKALKASRNHGTSQNDVTKLIDITVDTPIKRKT